MINEEWAGVNYLTSNSPPSLQKQGSVTSWEVWLLLSFLWKARQKQVCLTAGDSGSVQSRSQLLCSLPRPWIWSFPLRHIRHLLSFMSPTQWAVPTISHVPSLPALTAGKALVKECKEAFSVPVKKILSVSNCRIRHCFQWCRWLKGSFSAAFF